MKTQISISRLLPDQPSLWWRYRGGREFLHLLQKQNRRISTNVNPWNDQFSRCIVSDVLSCEQNFFHIAILMEVERILGPFEYNRKISKLLVVLDRMIFDEDLDDKIYDATLNSLDSQFQNQHDYHIQHEDDPTLEQWLETPGLFVLDMDMDQYTGDENDDKVQEYGAVVSVKLFLYPLADTQSIYMTDLINYYQHKHDAGHHRDDIKLGDTTTRKGREMYLAMLRDNQFISVMTQSGVVYFWRYHYESSDWKIFCDYDFAVSSTIPSNKNNERVTTKHLWIDEYRNRLISLEEVVTFSEVDRISRKQLTLKLFEFYLINNDNFSISPGLKILSFPIFNGDRIEIENIYSDVQMKYFQNDGALVVTSVLNGCDCELLVYSLIQGQIFRYSLSEELALSETLLSCEMLSRDVVYSATSLINGESPCHLNIVPIAIPWNPSRTPKNIDTLLCFLVNKKFFCLCGFSSKPREESDNLQFSKEFTVWNSRIPLPKKAIVDNISFVTQIQQVIHDNDFAYVAFLLQDGTTILQQLTISSLQNTTIDENCGKVLETTALRLLAKSPCDEFKFIMTLPQSFRINSSGAMPHNSLQMNFSVIPCYLASVHGIYRFCCQCTIDPSIESIDMNERSCANISKVLSLCFGQHYPKNLESDERLLELTPPTQTSEKSVVLTTRHTRYDSYYHKIDQFLFELLQNHFTSTEEFCEVPTAHCSVVETDEDLICFQTLSIVDLIPSSTKSFDIAALGTIIDPMLLIEISASLLDSCYCVPLITDLWTDNAGGCSGTISSFDRIEISQPVLTEPSLPNDNSDEVSTNASSFNEASEKGELGEAECENDSEEGDMFFRDVHSDSGSENIETREDEYVSFMRSNSGNDKDVEELNTSVHPSQSDVNHIMPKEVDDNINLRRTCDGLLPFIMRSLLLTHPNEAYDVINILFEFRHALLTTSTVDESEYEETCSLLKSIPTDETPKSRGENIDIYMRQRNKTSNITSGSKYEGESEGDLDMQSVESENHPTDNDHDFPDTHEHGAECFHDVTPIEPRTVASTLSSAKRSAASNQISPLHEILMYKIPARGANATTKRGVTSGLSFDLDSRPAQHVHLSKYSLYRQDQSGLHNTDVLTPSGGFAEEQLPPIRSILKLEDSALFYHVVTLVNFIFKAYFGGWSENSKRIQANVLCGSLLKSLPSQSLAMQNTLLKLLLRCNLIEDCARFLMKLQRPGSLVNLAVRIAASANFLSGEYIRWQAMLDWSTMRQKRERVSLSKLVNKYQQKDSNSLTPKDNVIQVYQEMLSRPSFFGILQNKNIDHSVYRHHSRLAIHHNLSKELLTFFSRYYGKFELHNVGDDIEGGSSSIASNDMHWNVLCGIDEIAEDIHRSPDYSELHIENNDFSFIRQHLPALEKVKDKRNLLARSIFFEALQYLCSNLLATNSSGSSNGNVVSHIKELVSLRPVSVSDDEIIDHVMRICSGRVGVTGQERDEAKVVNLLKVVKECML